MTRSFVCVLGVCVVGCGNPITGDWHGTASLDEIGLSRELGVEVSRDEAFRLEGRLVRAEAPGLGHGLTGTRVGPLVAFAWSQRVDGASEHYRVVGRVDGDRVEGALLCTRSVNGEGDGYCRELPVGVVALHRGALEVDAASDEGPGGHVVVEE